jgi:hypothetical protein
MPQAIECGILLRGYAKDEESVDSVATRLWESARAAADVGLFRIGVLVPADKDCGLTAARVRKMLTGRNGTVVFHPEGNENSDVLNFGMGYLRDEHCSYGFIVSNKAVGYLSHANFEKTLVALHKGAFVTGLAMRDTVPQENDEVFIGTLAGRVVNTFAAWDVERLLDVNGFDSRIGCEEIAPIIRGIRKYGKCVAPVIPVGQPVLNVSALRMSRHEWVASTKWQRQQQEALRVGGSFDLIQQNLLPGYPK